MAGTGLTAGRTGSGCAVSGSGLLLVGLVCLAWGARNAWVTHRFLGRAVRATGTVSYASDSESNTLLVQVRSEHGRLHTVRVAEAWWTLPHQYGYGDSVTILYDRARARAASLFGKPGRIATRAQVWSGTVTALGAGLLCLAAGMLPGLTRNRVGVSVRVRVKGAPDE